MEARHYKVILYAFFLCVVAAFAMWPPKQAYSQYEGVNVESKDYSLAETINKVDSLNHVIQLEIDLKQYQNRTDTVFNSQLNKKQ